jgi:peptidoglycan/xylan/chitin deacetylase (PgdA/CDA1 family)
MNLILSTKKVVAAFLYYSRMVDLFKSLNGDSSIILAYHRVVPKDYEGISIIQAGMYVTVETFEKHMAFISRNFRSMRLEDLIHDPIPRNACIVTFDDGWADNYTYAYPILKKYRIPATIFLSTSMIGSNSWPWPDRIAYYMHAVPSEDFLDTFRTILMKIGLEFSALNLKSHDKEIILEQVINSVKKMDNQKIISVMGELDQIMIHQKEHLLQSRPWLTWNEIMEMGSGDISFGSHTHNHVILDGIPLQQAREEIGHSKKILSERTGKPVFSFSYPNGDYNSDLMRVVKESGYSIAVTTRRGFLGDSDNLFTLRRLMIHDDMTSTIPMLACVMTNRIPFF